MQEDPTPQHEWLHRLVGEWSYSMSCPMGPEGAMVETAGRETFTKLGELWVRGELVGEFPGGLSVTGLMTLGFCPRTSRYIGNWIGTPSSHMFVYSGDREGDVLTLDCEGPSFADPNKIVPYQDVIEFQGDVRILRSQTRGEDGAWKEFMRSEFRRI
ncbi:MAG: DUF1579 domain-containing protein [Planctomycetota bacterium]